MNAKFIFTLGCITFALTCFTAPQVQAETIKEDGYAACISEDLFDEFVGYAVKKDRTGMRQLLSSGACVPLNKGTQVSVISGGFMTATIRYKGVKMYTNSEAIR